MTTTTPCAALPTLPAMEKFVPGYEASGWQGIGAPAGAPSDIVAIINRHVNAALADPVFSRRLVDLDLDPFATSPDELGRFIVGYDEKWRKVIKAANIKAE